MKNEMVKKFVIELSDEEYQIADQNQIDEMTEDALKFDGFLGFRIVCELPKWFEPLAEAYHKENMREVLIEFEVMARKNAFGLPEKSYLDNDLKDNVAGMVDNFLKEREG